MFLKGMRQTLPGWNLEGTATLQLKHVTKHGKNTGVLSLSESISIHTDLSGIYPNASGYPIFSRFFRISPDLSYLKSMDQCQCWTTTTAPSDATRKATKWPKGPCPSPRFHTFRVKNGSNSCGIYIYIYRLDDFGEF